jgi:hypothetical protein
VSRIGGLALGLIDDAAMFPPGNAPLADAVNATYARRDTPQAAVVGPLLVPASAVEDLRSHADPDEILDVALIGDTGLEGLIAARDALQSDAWIVLHQVELRSPKIEQPADGVRSLLGDLSFTVPAYVELNLEDDLVEALAVLAADGLERAKFRTGPFTVPTPELLAKAIGATVRLGVRFKLTGGLHHALPTHDHETGQHHHGFLNTLAATSLAIAGEQDEALVDVLRATDAEPVLSALSASEAGRVRDIYCSFGSCSIEDPFAELVRLGLADPA